MPNYYLFILLKDTKMITEHNIFDTNTTPYTLFIYTPFYFLFFIPFLQLRLSPSPLCGPPSRLCKPPSFCQSSQLSHTLSAHRPQLHPSLQIHRSYMYYSTVLYCCLILLFFPSFSSLSRWL